MATVEGTDPHYRLNGNELYVRAVVTSSEPPENPSFPDQRAQAWTQPVGWEAWIAPNNAASERSIHESKPRSEGRFLAISGRIRFFVKGERRGS